MPKKNKKKLYTKNEKDNEKKVDTNFSMSVQMNNQCTNKDINIFNFSIEAHQKKLFIETDLKINYGHKYGLIGRNGIGKSTLLQHIAYRKLPISEKMDVFYVEQEVESSNQTVFEMVLSAHQERIEMIFKLKKMEQCLEKENHNNYILDEYNELLEKMEAMGIDKDESLVRRILTGLGFNKEEQEYPVKQFSGGWRMRISLARALYMEPTVLMLDEPTNHLDLNAVIWLTEYLKTYKRTILVISHNQSFLNDVCNMIINIENQKLVYYSSNYIKFKKSYDQKLVNMEKEWNKVEKEIKKMQKESKSKKEQQEYLNEKKKNGIVKPDKKYEVKIRFPIANELKRPILEVHDVKFGFNEDKILFKEINFGIDMDTRMTIVGKNGIGKSSLINLLVGNLEPLEGEIIRNRCLKIGYYNQHFTEGLPIEKTPIEYIQSISLLSDEENSEPMVRKYLGQIGLEGNAHKLVIEQLSGGQKARVALVALMVMKPHLLFLDEPTNHLDIESIDGLIKGINQFNGGVIIISHDMNLIMQTNCLMYVLKDKQLTEYDGDYEDYVSEVLNSVD